MTQPGSRSHAEAPILDQALVAFASVIYVAGLVVVLARPSAPRPASIAATPETTTPAAPTAAATEILTRTPLSRHTISFELPPGKGLEFKYRLEQNAGMTYVWMATGVVKAEFHGEPDGARAGYSDTYKLSEGTEGRGTLVAPTTGIHGWYWENTGTSPVTVTLESSGFYTAGIEFTPAGPVERPINK